MKELGVDVATFIILFKHFICTTSKHFQLALVNLDHASALKNALMDFMNQIVFPGKIPDWMFPIFYGAQLIALSKPDGGVRPISQSK